MTKKGYLGITAFTVFVIAVGGFIYWQLASVEQLKEQADQDTNRLEEAHKPEQPSEANKPPRKARAGFEWEWHGDHWHEMPIDTPDTGQGELHEPVSQPAPKEYTGPLTYHEELLKTNPVKALRLQAEERGHWSAEWIPHFPPDDEEAAEIARTQYLIIYYDSISDTTNPICQKAFRDSEARMVAKHKKSEELVTRYETLTYEDMVPPSEEYKQLRWERARMNDLARLGWALVTEGLIIDPKRFASKTLLSTSK